MEWKSALMSLLSIIGTRFLMTGVLGLGLAIIFSEYSSKFLYAHYQSWSGWRSVTGSNPNFLTSVLYKISWSVFFLSSWFMIWKLDSFFIFNNFNEDNRENEVTRNAKIKNQEKNSPEPKENESIQIEKEKDESQSTFEPEQNPENNEFSSEDLKYAKILGLEAPFEISDIKSTYRKVIAQYHPDRVVAMGPEIKEVAEIKAKEINEAYEHLRKSFNIT